MAIGKVIQTLVEAVVLVFLVMWLFLQNLRYTLIPIHRRARVSGWVPWPSCTLLGFSVNMMTMFGMVLAIGILVDDAIVVVENVERIMAEEGLAPVDGDGQGHGAGSGRDHRYHPGAGRRCSCRWPSWPARWG